MVFTFASPPFLLQAILKDQSYIEDLTTKLTDACTLLFGARFTNTHDLSVTLLGASLYQVIISLSRSGQQTLGEEFTDVLPVYAEAFVSLVPAKIGSTSLVSSLAYRMYHVSLRRRLVFLIVSILEPLLTRMLALRLFPDVDVNRILTATSKFQLILFFIFGVYATMAHRVASLRFIALTPSRQRDANGAELGNPYWALGLMMLVQGGYQWYQFMKERRRKQEEGQRTARRLRAEEDEARQISGEEEDSREEEGGSTGRCTLCLNNRTAPTSTKCGHIYCWSCITSCINSGRSICPMCRQHVSLQALVALQNYVAPRDSLPLPQDP